MNRQDRLINLILLLIPISLLWIGWGAVSSPYLTHTSSAVTPGSWQLLIHKGFNTTFWWFSSQSSISLGKEYFELTCSLIALVVIVMAALTSMRGEDSADRVSLIVSSLVPITLLVLLFGLDTPLITFTSQLGMTIYCWVLMRTGILEHLRRGMVFTLLASFFNVMFCTQLSPYMLMALGAVVFATVTDNRRSSLQPLLITLFLVVSAAFVYSLSIQLSRPAIPEFGYPATARVVPDDGVAGNILPLLGETTIIPYIDRPALKQTFTLPALLLFCLSLIFFSQRYFSRRALTWVTFAIAMCMVIDTIPSDPISSLAPLETLRRIMPGLFAFSLLPLSCAVLIPLMWVISARAPVRTLLLALCLTISGAAPGALNRLPDLFADANTEDPRIIKIVASPSLDLLRREGIETLALLERRSELTPVTVAALDGTISTSHRRKDNLRKLLSDARPDTRWSPRRGAQYGDEWLQIQLRSPIEISGIQMLPGKFFSDFPRGIAIDTCQSNSTVAAKSTQRVREIPDWQGGLALSPQGFPYFNGQHDVTILFHSPIVTDCLKFSQIAESAHYDWSVAELRLLVSEGVR